MRDQIQSAREKLLSADAVLIGAGAGMGVDSGLPDFRGNEGFWKAYPPFKKLGLSFYDLANPQWFYDDPQRAWGFYGHRLNLYRSTQPHEGFAVLRDFLIRNDKEHFVFTSNVDGHFQRAEFELDRVVECHGAIDFVQCSQLCTGLIEPADEIVVGIDEDTMRARQPLPMCKHCGSVQRPNILMFGDWNWVADRTESQLKRYEYWLNEHSSANLVAIEFGAGTAVPTVRYECERRAEFLIRVNPREPELQCSGIGLEMGAADAIRQLCKS